MRRFKCFATAVFVLGFCSFCGLANAQGVPLDEMVQQHKETIAEQDARNSLSEDLSPRRPAGTPHRKILGDEKALKKSLEETEQLMERTESKRKLEQSRNPDGSLSETPQETGINLDDNTPYNPIGWILGTITIAAVFYGLVLWIKSRHALNGGICRKCGQKWRLANSEPSHYTSTELRRYTCACGAETQRVTSQGAADPTDSRQ